MDRRLKTGAHFDGSDYEPHLDKLRLTGQIRRVWAAMVDGQWRTLRQIARATGDPESSISAQLRNLRKEKFGGFTVNKCRAGNQYSGWWEYQLESERQTEMNF